MIEIKDWVSGEVLHVVEADTLKHTDLTDIKLQNASLREANLFGTNLTGTSLAMANLVGANLREANLSAANLFGTNLVGANLVGANFFFANLQTAELNEALLIGANLAGANLTETNLIGADLNEAIFGLTVLAHSSTLHLVKGLETVEHQNPSYIDSITLQNCLHGLPDVFLEGCGYTREQIEVLRALYHPSPIRYFSCFLSHAEADLPFADRLLNDLRANNVTCWHYKADMRGGREWEDQINEAIKVHDKLLLICSRHSIYSKNVVREIIKALREQQTTGEQKLFPLMLDHHILNEKLIEEGREFVKSEEWATNWVPAICRLHIPFFAGWDKDNALYTREFTKLLDALRQSATRKEGEQA